MSRARAATVAMILAPVLMASKCHPDEPPIDDGPTDLIPPEVELQVVSIDPAHGTTGTPFAAQVYGSEFQDGARVVIGTSPSPRVSWQGENSLAVTVPALEDGFYDVTVINPDGEQAVLRRGVTISGDTLGASCRDLVVYFDFNSYDLTGAGLGLLSGQADCLRSARGNLRVEGNCDERGTTEYNISLGDRRAQAVQRWLVGQGVSPARINTVSYGEERPAAHGHTEEAWSQNRRVEIHLQD